MTVQQQTYGLVTRIDTPYADAIERTRAALQAEGFGVLTEIDVKQTMKTKLDADFRPYVILGACNPQLAHRALQAELDIGLLLPCNVVVYEADDGGTIVAAMDPEAALGVVKNPAIQPIATEAKARLRRALAGLR